MTAVQDFRAEPGAGVQARLALSLLLMRLSAAAFLGVWTAMKLLTPERALGVYSKFFQPIFQVALPVEAFLVIGLLQAAIVLAFALGLVKFWSYGAVLIMHGVSTFSTLPQLLSPSEGTNMLFWAAVPVLAGCAALFLLRDQDRWSLGR